LVRADQPAYRGDVAQVDLYEAKIRLSQLLDQALAGEDVIIARNGTPVVQLVPVQRKPVRRQPGAWKGMGWIADEFDETPDEVTESFCSGSIEPE
jgi:prevent-host-death family protein